eukprot:jgi/Bigna1/67841/fgenesh1_pg.4_\
MDDIEDLGKDEMVQREERFEVMPKSFKRSQKRRDKDPIESSGNIPGTQSVYVKTWGCSHNNSDGEFMAGQLATYGYQIVDKREDADLWVLNSCTVKAPSQDVFVNAIKAGKELKKPMVLCGCVPQGDPKMKIFQGASLLGVNQIDRIVEVAEETLKGHSVRLLSTRREKKDRVNGPQGTLNLPKIRKNPLIEIISINSGCLNQVQRAQLAIRQGVREIWLTSEDTGTYGRDIGYSLPQLMRDLIEVTPEGVMIKLGMSNPPYFLEYLAPMAEIFKHPRVYSVLHVPVQAGSDEVLSRMRRKYTVADFCRVVDFLRGNVPEMSIHTDIICGFPEESVDDWKETLALVKKYKFPALHISQFYPRPGTPAAKMKRVNTKEVKRRSKEMTELFLSYETLSGKVGKTYKVLATEIAKDKKHYVAHNKCYDQILVPMEEGLLGRTFEVKITGSGKFHLNGKILRDSLRAPRTLLPKPLPKGTLSNTNSEWKSVKSVEKGGEIKREKFEKTKDDPKRTKTIEDQGPAKVVVIAVIVVLIAALYLRISAAMETTIYLEDQQ